MRRLIAELEEELRLVGASNAEKEVARLGLERVADDVGAGSG